MQILKFTVYGTLPDMNEIIKVSKSHFAVYAKLKKKHTQQVVDSIKELPAVQSADFLFQWYLPNKRKDPDNVAAGGTKMLLDGIVEAGVLPNDGYKQVKQITHKFYVDKDNPRIEVTIFEV